jgi:hypothetical protein
VRGCDALLGMRTRNGQGQFNEGGWRKGLGISCMQKRREDEVESGNAERRVNADLDAIMREREKGMDRK